jgi:outer membrane protein OmpA-like peptidoglycan-associated protein
LTGKSIRQIVSGLSFLLAFSLNTRGAEAVQAKPVAAKPSSEVGKIQALKVQKPAVKKVVDPTSQVKFAPGLEFIFHIYDGLDTRWQPVGDYDFVARLEEASNDGYIYDWHMGAPSFAAGSRRTEGEDVKHARKISLFYPQHESCTLVGYTNALRISDDLYRDLKAGRKSTFTIDGPESVMVLHSETVPVPHSIKGMGSEIVQTKIEGNLVNLRCIKAVCDNGWAYWILDNPRFPLMVQGNAPFRWVTALNNAYGLGNADKEAKDIFDKLKNGGIATSYLILFDFDRDTLRPLSKDILRSLSKYLKVCPSLRLQVEGHTCTIGGYDYNMNLSDRRARSVKRYLVEACGIDAGRLESQGFGYTQPASSNQSGYGRSRNRRVVFKKLP